MKTSDFNNQKSKQRCLITFNWLILLTIIISFGINGCVPQMNSNGQRVGKKQSQLSNVNRSKSKKEKEYEKQLEQNTSTNSGINDVLEFEKKINNSSYSKNIDADNKYEALMKRQQALEAEFDEGISNVKEELLEVKRILSEIAADKIKISAGKNDNVKSSPSASTESATIKSAEDKILDKTFIIQSEEVKSIKPKPEVNKPKADKNFKIAKTASVKPAPAPISVKEKEIVIQDVEQVNTSNSNENNFTDVISKVAKGDYNAASKVINDKLKQSKDPVVISNCNYWLGEISFNQRDYAKSIAYFNTALNNNCDKKDIAQSRIAEAYLRVGKNDEAKIAYQNLLKEYPKSTHSPKAKKMLQQL